MIPMRDVYQFSAGDRLFYELGYKIDSKRGVGEDNWVRTGRFKEVKNPMQMIVSDSRIKDLEYLEHHNFMMIKKSDQ